MSTATFIGVYSSMSQEPKAGRGSGKRKRYWFAWDCGDAGYQVQALDKAFQPQSEAVSIDPSTFCASFSLEPSILATPIRKSPVPASPFQPQEGVPPAKTSEQLGVERTAVENHLRDHFDALLLKTRRDGDPQSLLRALQDIAEVEEGIVPEHKYMFAEFGISLRKGKLPEIALAHAKRVLSLAPGDSHAHFNIARIYHTLGKLDETEQHLLAALEFSPDLECAREFLVYIGKERRQKELSRTRMQRR
ncbi:MAG: tetratricopeptide repeat protein [Desulfovibrionaceae bacterium]|nr:tetratricopeptide repeat protein [Desulfovibrionaceae bacterium]